MQERGHVDAHEQPPARSRRATAPSSGRRCRRGSRTRRRTRARGPAAPSSEPGIGDDRELAARRPPAPRPTRGGCGSRSWSRTSTTRGAACASGGHAWRCGRSRPGRWCRARAGAGRPGAGSKVRASTSGNRLEPPMPMTTTWVDAVDAARRSASSSAGQVGEHLGDDRDPARAGRPPRWGRPARGCGRRRTAGATASRSTRSARAAPRRRSKSLMGCLPGAAVMRAATRRVARRAAPISSIDVVGVGQAGEQRPRRRRARGRRRGRAGRGRRRRSAPSSVRCARRRSRPGASAPKYRPTSGADLRHDGGDAGRRRSAPAQAAGQPLGAWPASAS